LLILPQCLTAVCSTFSSTESYPIWVGFAVSCRGMNSSNSCRKLFRIQPPLYVCAENSRQTVMLQQRWSGCQHYVTWGLWCVCCPLALYSSFLSIYSVSKKRSPVKFSNNSSKSDPLLIVFNANNSHFNCHLMTHFFAKCDENMKPVRIIRIAVTRALVQRYWIQHISPEDHALIKHLNCL